jgi:hypothetical protein
MNEIDTEYLQRVLSSIYEFRENRHKEDRSFRMGEFKITFLSAQ